MILKMLLIYYASTAFDVYAEFVLIFFLSPGKFICILTIN